MIEGGKFEMPKCIWEDVIIRDREFSRGRGRHGKNMNFSVMALASGDLDNNCGILWERF